MAQIVREMTAKDVNAAVSIITAHCGFDGQAAARYYAGYFGEPARLSSAIEANCVVEDESTSCVLGVSGFEPDKYATPEIWWLTWTYVSADARRQGVGTKLLEHVKQRVRELGGRKLYLDTSSDTIYHAAIEFYKVLGFTLQAQLPDYYGQSEDFVILGLDL
jgi:ribosomal protein S18 acetylase RimI-like enzyme